MRVYLAGPITQQQKDYKQRFEAAENKLMDSGYEVVNPARNIEYTYKGYIDLGLFELMHCDAIYMLNGWEKSPGAILEYQYAKTVGMLRMFEGQEV